MSNPRTTVRVHLQSDVKVESLNEIISTIVGRYGCRTCGLIGVDLHLTGDPGDLSQIKGLSGVRSVALE